MDTEKIGNKIALLRKEHRYTQEALAEVVQVSPQAVSKWENGRALPDTALLPRLAKALHTSIDNLLSQNDLQVLSASYGDGIENVDVADRLNRLIQNDRLELEVNDQSLACSVAEGHPTFLIVRYQMGESISYIFAREREHLLIDGGSCGIPPLAGAEKVRIVAAVYGTERRCYDVMPKIEHYRFFEWDGYPANHEAFPSDPANDEKEYLTLVYLNQDGIHLATCEEGERLQYTTDKCNLFRKRAAGEHYIPDVPEFPAFGEGQECSWAAALTGALQAMGVPTDYDRVMGVSGACYRLSFCTPDWDFSSADGLVVYDFAEPAYAAFGYQVCFEEHMEKEYRAEVRKRIIANIAEDKPVLAINLRVAPEWGIICGYKEWGEDLFCRTKYDREIIESTAYQSERPNELDYLFVDNWPFRISYFGERGVPPTEKENLIRSLQILIDCNKQGTVRGYATGVEAYRVWAEELRQNAWYEGRDEEALSRRLAVNQFCVLALWDARKAAASYLASGRGLLPEWEDEMGKVVSCFEKVAALAASIKDMLGLEGSVAACKVRGFWTKKKRETQAETLLKMRQLELEAIGAADKIVSGFGQG